MPPQNFRGLVISGDRADASSASPSRFEAANRLCTALGIQCARSPAVFLTTNGKSRCGRAGDALQGEQRGTVGLHLAQQDAWATVAASAEPAFIFEDDAALPEHLHQDRARALLHGLLAQRLPPSPASPSNASARPDLLKLGHWQHVCNQYAARA